MKSTPPLLPPAKDGHGFALISVLALVSLAALTATAFLASARLEKTAAMTTGDQTRLTLALDSGYHLASFPYTTGDNTWNWADFLVGEDADGVGYLFHAVPKTNTTTGEWTNYALFSCATMSNFGRTLFNPSSWAASTIQQGGFASNRLNSSSQLSKLTKFSTTNVTPSGPVTRIPLLFSRTSPVVNWITNYVTNPSTGLLSPTFRFAYFTEDLSGLIDAERMGGSTSRDTGTNPTEIALGEVGITTNFGTFTNLRRLFLTPGMIEDVLRVSNVTNGSVTNPWRYLSSSLYSMNGLKTDRSTRAQGFLKIPSGMGYVQGDTVILSNISANKYNLNDIFLSNGTANADPATNFSKITSAIATNLPKFASIRSGGMKTNVYLGSLAANIIDYADADSSAISTNIGSAANKTNIIGFDSYPMLTHLYDQFTYNAAGGTITHTTWMQFWNPSTQPTIAVNVTVNFTNNDIVRYTNTTITNTNRLYPPPGQTTTSFNLPIISPNAGFVTNFTRPNISLAGFPGFVVPGPPKISLNSAISGTTLPCSDSFSYTISGATITPAMTIKRQNNTLTNGLPEYCAGFLAGNQYIAGAAVAATTLPIHDPRMTPYLGQGSGGQYAQSAYATTYWRGYVSQSGLTANMGLADPAFWPDGASQNVASHGTNGGTAAPTPGAFQNPESAPCKISNSGSYTNICALGNIFDPIQWRPPATTANNYANTNIDSNWTADPVYGGGSTLRIGRPEHSRFAWTNVSGQIQPNMQGSAAALLDIFCVTTNNPSLLSGRFDDGDQININTAPPLVLRALAAGVKLNNGYSIPSNAVNSFVTGVTNFRAKYPFYSASQLAFIGTNADWPNTNTWPAGAVFSKDSFAANNTTSAWDDEAVEEWFSKIYGLSKVQSRNYRIYVQAQLIRTKGTNTNASTLSFGSIARRYYDVLNSQNDASNPPTCSIYLLRKVDY